MNILVISTLYPTPGMPSHGIFVHNRISAMRQEPDVDLTVINPIPTSPVHRLLKRYQGQQSAPLCRSQNGFDIYHPRYFTIPGVAKASEHQAVINAIRPVAEALHWEKPFDCIDVHWTYPDLPLALTLSEAWGVPCRVTLRGMEAFYADSTDDRKHIIAAALSRVEHVISLSEEMAVYANQIAHTGERTTVITNGSDTSRFTYIPQVDAAQQLGLDGGGKIIVGVGALIKRKGFHHVVEALATLKRQGTPWPISYYILGAAGMEGDFENELRRTIARHGLEHGPIKVILQGKVDNATLPLWYNAADVFCLSSLGEGSPNVLTEALSTGCPAIACDVGAVRDIMARQPDLGRVLPNLSKATSEHAASVWAEAITLALEAPVNRSLQSQRMKKYTWSWCAREALRVLRCSVKD